MEEIRKYIRKIRNQNKKDYALNYLAYKNGNISDHPEYEGISYMAAQAVRMNIDAIMDNNNI